ncbi:MAG: hypothetical protein ACR652_05175 [Methylocystis sp.]|uniref:hypothetical protein n=1 Tax=Methylocystis sp. TaxID=1911079 RepID=UPI003DA1ED4D
MPDDVNQIEVFWKNRLSGLEARAKALRDTELPNAEKNIKDALARLAKAQQTGGDAAGQAEGARKALSTVPMPADTATLQAQWEKARKDFAQAQADAAAAGRALALALGARDLLTKELDDTDAATSDARSNKSIAETQALGLAKLKDNLKSDAFTKAQGKAAGLLTEADDARAKIDSLLPDKMSAVLTKRRKRDLDALAQLPRAGADRWPPSALGVAQATLASCQSAAEELLKDAEALVAEAEPTLAAWKKLAPGTKGSPVTDDQRKLLDSDATTHAAGLSALADAEDVLANLEKDWIALYAAALEWAAPGESGHTPDGPDLSKEQSAVDAALKDYQNKTALTEKDLWAACAALANVPDDWVVVSERHRRLNERLVKLASPLGHSDPGAAVATLSKAVGQIASEHEKTTAAADGAARYARLLKERKAKALMQNVLSDARAAAAPGGVFIFN